jgi:Flp pilus assembly protein TadG
MIRPQARDRGAADALGLALIAPAAIGLAVVIVFLGRGVDSRATVQIAAESAAQAAAQERTVVAARVAAERIGTTMLVDRTSCESPEVVVDVSDFRPGGQVAVTVSCTVSGAGLELVGPPQSEPTRATAFATIDPFRAGERAP